MLLLFCFALCVCLEQHHLGRTVSVGRLQAAHGRKAHSTGKGSYFSGLYDDVSRPSLVTTRQSLTVDVLCVIYCDSVEIG